MEIMIKNVAAMLEFGAQVGAEVKSGSVIELVGDVGAGKTTFVKGLGRGLAIDEDIQSPSFTISRVYDAHDDLRLMHYDFYRLNEPGVMQMELHESVHASDTVVVIEWGDVVSGVLPADRLTIRFSSPTENARNVVMSAGGEKSKELLEAIK